MKTQNKIVWRALSKSMADGYGYASSKISSGLTREGLPLVKTEDILRSGIFDEYDLLVSENDGIQFVPTPKFGNQDIMINNCLPVDYKLGDCYNIGFSYWETTKIPSSWVPRLNDCDEVWTTSEWACGVFKENTGHENVRSFKLGIESQYFYPSESVPDGPFTFLHVGSPSTRKNTQMAFDAFLKTYGSNKDFKLIIKSIGPPDARFTDGVMNLGPVSSHNRVEVIDYEISEEDLGELYRSVHCLIYPTMGEGWGMIPFNSIGCGTPTICTNATSCEEYAELSVPLDFKWSDKGMAGIYNCGGKWAEPSMDDLMDKMIYVVNNYEEVKRHTLKGATIIHKEYSWNSVVKEYKDRICQIWNQ